MTEQQIRADERRVIAERIAAKFGLLAPYALVVEFIKEQSQ